MPRRTRNSRKKAVCPPSAASKKKLNAIAVDTEGESLDSLLNDFEIQTTTLKKQALKQFEKQAKQMLTALPMKTSIPKEVLKLDIAEFIRRGGSFQSVWESLKLEKLEKQSAKAKPLLDCAQSSSCFSSLEAVQHESQTNPAVLDGEPLDYITPALNTQRAVARRDQIPLKRKPKPLEEVKVQAFSNASGSPVDEKVLLQLHKEDLLGNIQEQLMEATARFPHKWRSKLISSFREMKKQTQSNSSEDVLVTPAIRR